jgi:hypothetical protein
MAFKGKNKDEQRKAAFAGGMDKSAKKNKVFKVMGITPGESGYSQLGFTSSPSAWKKYPNGWAKEPGQKPYLKFAEVSEAEKAEYRKKAVGQARKLCDMCGREECECGCEMGISPRTYWDVQSRTWRKDVSPLTYYKEPGILEVTDLSGKRSRLFVRTKEEFARLKASSLDVQWVREPRDFMAEKVAEATFEGIKSEASKVLLGTPDEYALEGVADKFATPATVRLMFNSNEVTSEDIAVRSASDMEKLRKMPGIVMIHIITPPLEVPTGDGKGKYYKSPAIVRLVRSAPGGVKDVVVYSKSELDAITNPKTEEDKKRYEKVANAVVIAPPTYSREVIKGRPSLGSLTLTGVGEVGKFGVKAGKKVGSFAVKEGKVLGAVAKKEAPKLARSAASVGGAAAKESAKIGRVAAVGAKNVVGNVFNFFKKKTAVPVGSPADDRGVVKVDKLVAQVEDETVSPRSKVCQINRWIITKKRLDETLPGMGKKCYSVLDPSGKCMEDNLTFAQAKEFATENTDFLAGSRRYVDEADREFKFIKGGK